MDAGMIVFTFAEPPGGGFYGKMVVYAAADCQFGSDIIVVCVVNGILVVGGIDCADGLFVVIVGVPRPAEIRPYQFPATAGSAVRMSAAAAKADVVRLLMVYPPKSRGTNFLYPSVDCTCIY